MFIKEYLRQNVFVAFVCGHYSLKRVIIPTFFACQEFFVMIRKIAISGMIAALYAALTVALS
ncbi:MAG: hypothetical protein M0P37_11045, partial [Synergistaceae bacterium]|nr:hypothetical protein [Synergistaceae bacterium]